MTKDNLLCRLALIRMMSESDKNNVCDKPTLSFTFVDKRPVQRKAASADALVCVEDNEQSWTG